MFGYEDELLIKRDPSVQLDSVHLPIITSVKRISLQIVQTCSCSFIYEKTYRNRKVVGILEKQCEELMMDSLGFVPPPVEIHRAQYLVILLLQVTLL